MGCVHPSDSIKCAANVMGSEYKSKWGKGVYELGKAAADTTTGKGIAWTGKQLLRPGAAVAAGVGAGLAFGAKAGKEKASATYKQFVNQTAALRGQKPGQAFVRKEQPKVMPGLTGCRDVRTFGGTRTRTRTRKRSKKFYQTTRKRKT